MTIQRMTAVFGVLDGETLTLQDGLNILRLPNEGGKSTWCAFLRAMLYGVPTRERDRDGYLAEKNRYQPWSGKPMEGEIDLTWNGRAITLRRTSKPNAPFGVFEAVYTGTAEPVPGMTRENVGELLTGVGREVFERTAFVGQNAVTVTAAPELERRVAALLLSGEEDISYAETERRLRDWRNARQSNTKTGAIPKARAERAALRDTLARIDAAREREHAAREHVEQYAAQKSALERELAAHRSAAQAARRARYEKAVAALADAEAAEAEQAAHAVPMPTPPQPTAARGQRNLRMVAIVLAVLGLVNLFRAVTDPAPLWWIGAGLTALLAVLTLVLARTSGARAAETEAAARRVYEDALRDVSEREARMAETRADAARARAVVETMERDGIPDAPPNDPPVLRRSAAEAEGEYQRIVAALDRAEHDRAAAVGELRAVGDPAEIAGRLDELDGALAALGTDYDALTLAIECLSAAGALVQERFSPRLNAAAGELFSALTGGAYVGVTLTRDFAAKAAQAGGITPRPALALSRGTMDQLYLALRLALCDLTFEGQVPIVLDDALAAFDDIRMARALDYLQRAGRQVLLFSCHTREAAWAGAAER